MYLKASLTSSLDSQTLQCVCVCVLDEELRFGDVKLQVILEQSFHLIHIDS